MATVFFRQLGFAKEPYHSVSQQVTHFFVCLARRVRVDLAHGRLVHIFFGNEGARVLYVTLTKSAKLEQR